MNEYVEKRVTGDRAGMRGCRVAVCRKTILHQLGESGLSGGLVS